MPKEVRYMLFSQEEVLTALLEYPLGSVATRPRTAHESRPRLKLFNGANGSVAAHLIYEDNAGTSLCLELGTSELLGALLTYCASMRLMLPRLSHKSLELMSDRLVMASTLNTASARDEAAQGRIRYLDPERESLSMSAT
jgi:hypothetical protein